MVNKRSLSYCRNNKQLDLKPKVANSTSLSENISTVSDVRENIPIAYTKTDGFLSYSLVCVISGGTKRERTFLSELERKHTFHNLSVVFVSSPKGKGGLTPRMMKDVYDRICKNGKLILPGRTVLLDEVDSIYMFTDVDHYEEDLKDILNACNATEVKKWIISNPDFEVWIYYCYRNNPIEDLFEITCADPSKRSSLLKTINGKFNNGGGLDTRKAFESLKTGIIHSKEHYSENNGIPSLLSTQMHLFAEDVLLRLGDEYNQWILNKRKKMLSKCD